MLTCMGVIDLKFAKGGRKLKKRKHYTIPPNLEKMKSEKASEIRKISYLLCVGKERRKRHHDKKICKKMQTKT